MPDKKGLKRVCASCQTKFYDFNKSPIICPKCKAEFTGVVKIRTRRGRNVIDEAKAKAANEQDDETVEVAEEDDRTTVSLEEVEEDENKVADDEDETGGDLDLDDLDDDDDDDGDDDEDLEDLDDEIEVEEKE